MNSACCRGFCFGVWALIASEPLIPGVATIVATPGIGAVTKPHARCGDPWSRKNGGQSRDQWRRGGCRGRSVRRCRLPGLDGMDNVLLLRTLSKGYSLAGLRFGYGLGHPKLIEAMDKARDSYNTDALAQAEGVENWITLFQREIGMLHKVLPTALVAAACRPHMPLSELRDRIDNLLVGLSAQGANLAVRTGADAVAQGIDLLSDRGVVVVENQRLRVRDRIVLRYYGRTLEHLLQPRQATH